MGLNGFILEVEAKDHGNWEKGYRSSLHQNAVQNYLVDPKIALC